MILVQSARPEEVRDELKVAMNREEALKGIGRAYLVGAGITFEGETGACDGLPSQRQAWLIGRWLMKALRRGYRQRYRLKDLG